MKTFITNLLVLFTLISCTKDETTRNPLDQLPPMTTSGKNTIGCLVNGEPFTDSGLMTNFYQFINGEFFLGINWEQRVAGNWKDGNINLRRVSIIEGQTYKLNINSIRNDFTGGSAKYSFRKEGEYETNPNYFGTITFIRFDTKNQIMSGTFEFQAQEITTGEIINITNGRFDLTFTK